MRIAPCYCGHRGWVERPLSEVVHLQSGSALVGEIAWALVCPWVAIAEILVGIVGLVSWLACAFMVVGNVHGLAFLGDRYHGPGLGG